MRLTGPILPVTAMSDSGVARSPRPRSTVWHGGAQVYDFQRPPMFTWPALQLQERLVAAGRDQWPVGPHPAAHTPAPGA